MRLLIRNLATTEYLAQDGRWTLDQNEAIGFKDPSEAFEQARQLVATKGAPMEVIVLAEDSDRTGSHWAGG
jgi:hypothetical protein